jgi:hypothetical protein
MNWLSGLSQSDKAEMYLDLCEAYNSEQINELEFRGQLARLGYNATDIEDCVKQHQPLLGDPE